jgi:signal transduction histidine kinase
MWWGVFFGALAVNLTTAGSIVSALGIAFGNTLEAVLGAYLVIRLANGRNVFDRAEGVFKFFLLACVVATTASASIGTASLALTGFSRGVRWESLWSTWWLGNMAGAVLVTPCFLLWSSRTEARGRQGRVVLQSIALLSLLLAGAIVFGGFSSVAGQYYALKFMCIPIAVWVAFECRPRETALAVLGFSAIAIGSALHAGRGTSIPNDILLVVQIFMIVVAITGLLVSVAVSERNRHADTLVKAKIELEERVLERTSELEDRIARQERAEQSVRGLSARLLQTQDWERRRIARELHDSTGQTLAALTMNLGTLSKKAASVDAELSSALEENARIAQALSDELRTTSYLLHPPLLDEMGLQAGLRWYVRGFQERTPRSHRLESARKPGTLAAGYGTDDFPGGAGVPHKRSSPFRERLGRNLSAQVRRNTYIGDPGSGQRDTGKSTRRDGRAGDSGSGFARNAGTRARFRRRTRNHFRRARHGRPRDNSTRRFQPGQQRLRSLARGGKVLLLSGSERPALESLMMVRRVIPFALPLRRLRPDMPDSQLNFKARLAVWNDLQS